MGLRDKTRIGIIWTSATIIFSKSIHIVAGIILARILFPSDFGLYAVALLVKKFARRLTQLGFAAAIIQRKEITSNQINTIFTVTLFVNSLVIGLVYIGSSLIGYVLESTEVVPLVRVISLTFLLLSFANIAESLLKKHMKFKEVSFAVGAGSFVRLLSPIPLALLGFGVWSMVIGDLIGTVVRTVVALWKSKWIPRFFFRFSIFRELYAYGVKVSVVSYMDYFVSNIDYMLISKFLGMTQLGYYERAFNIMNLTRTQLHRAINDALFSAYSKIKDDYKNVVRNLKDVLRFVSFIGYPILIWLYFAAPSLITQLYGTKWVPTIKPLQIMCVSGLLNTLTMVFFPVIFAVDLLMQRIKVQFFFLIVLGGTIYYALPHGIIGVSYAIVVSYAMYLLLILFIVMRSLPFTIGDFLVTQKGPFIYGGIQVCTLYSIVQLTKHWVSADSFIMLFLVSFGTIVALLVAHLVFRFQDAQDFVAEIVTLFGKVKGLKTKSSA